jgi:hypothetical protein
MNVPIVKQEENDTGRGSIEFYGHYQVYSESGIDLTLLRENRKLTVTDRWEQNLRALQMVEAFREAGRVRRSSHAQASDRLPS